MIQEAGLDLLPGRSAQQGTGLKRSTSTLYLTPGLVAHARAHMELLDKLERDPR